MKKLFFTLLTLCLCGATWAYDFSAEVTNKDGSTTTFYFSYNVDKSGNHVTTNIDGTEYQTVEVRSKSTNTDTLFDYTDTYSGELTIPATVTYEGTTYAVTGLGHNSIRTSSLTKLTIPSTIEYIGTMAVYNCKSLADVIIEYAETPLEIRCTDTNSLPAFGYSQIKTLELDRDLTIVDSEYSTPFYTNTYIENVIIGENVKELTAHAFERCTKLTEVTVSNNEEGKCSLATIGDCAFMSCTSLEHITIPASVTTLGADCFMGCTSLRNVFLLATDPSAETLSGDDFQSDTNVTLYVPRGTAAAYYASEWQEKVVSRGNVSFNFYNLTTISEDTKYTDEKDENETYYYATYYYDKEGEGENDIYEVDDTSKTLYAVTGVDEGVVKMEALNGDIIPKNTPLLIESSTPGAYYMWRNYYEKDDEGNEEPFYEDSPTTINNVPTKNMLYGHSEAGMTSVNGVTDGYKFYKLSLDSNSTGGSIGFYYGAEGGASYNAGANRCWLAVSGTEVTNLSYLSFKKNEGDTTGISSVESAVESASVKGIYTIQGVRVSNMNQPGLYIVDGKKVLVK